MNKMIHYTILLLLFFFDPEIFVPFAFVALLNVFIKHNICPWLVEEYPWMEPYLRRPYSSDFGMPSGHCQVYWAFITFAVPYYQLSTVLAAALILFGFCVAWQRLEDDQHNEEQVLVGSLLGVVCGTYIHYHYG